LASISTHTNLSSHVNPYVYTYELTPVVNHCNCKHVSTIRDVHYVHIQRSKFDVMVNTSTDKMALYGGCIRALFEWKTFALHFRVTKA